MSRRLIAAFLVLPLLSGCCAPVVLHGDAQMLEDANGTLAGRSARITRTTGEQFEARDVRISAEAVSWGVPGESRRMSVPVQDVEAVRVTWRGTGALWGLLIGGGSFAVLAAASYFSNTDEPYADLAFVFLPVVGTLIGVPIGAGGACREFDLSLLKQSAREMPAREDD